jgi:PAS domain S-box-containing protein
MTEQNATLAELQRSERRFQQLADSIDAVFYIHELDTKRISYVSRAYETIWGRSRAELYADPTNFLQAVHPEDLERVKQSLSLQIAGHSREIEYRLRRADGSERIIHDRPLDAIDPDTGTRRVLGLATDVTEVRRTEALLARNAETFRNLVQSNPFGVYVIDSAFKLIELSRGARPVFAGIEPLVGRDHAEIMRIIWPEPFASEVIGRYRHTLVTGEPYVSLSTVEMRADTAEIEAYDWRIERIVLPDGQYGVVCYFYDLSERNAYEARLKQAVADKELLAREIDHRVKNSLAVVGSLLTMQRGASASAEAAAALTQAADRVMAVARIHEGLHKAHQLGVIAFGDYLNRLCRDLEHALKRPGTTMAVATTAIDLPAEIALPLALIANELVTNAFKHGASSGATAITISLAPTPEGFVMTVADNGAGMPPATTANAGLGSRLVQALCRQIGAAFVMPAPGTPARFSVTVPHPAPAEGLPLPA